LLPRAKVAVELSLGSGGPKLIAVSGAVRSAIVHS
jgi:hypothetical protein